jgi:hypothetical protein
MISYIPWGWFMTMLDKRLKFFWVIKAIRIGQLNYYLRDRIIQPFIRSFFEGLQNRMKENQ